MDWGAAAPLLTRAPPPPLRVVCRARRLSITAPQLVSLRLQDFVAFSVQMADVSSLASIELHGCGKMPDAALQQLLRLQGPAAAPMPTLRSLAVVGALLLSDETLRLTGQRHAGVTQLTLGSCPAVGGSGLSGTGGGWASLQQLQLQCCDGVARCGEGQALACSSSIVGGCLGGAREDAPRAPSRPPPCPRPLAAPSLPPPHHPCACAQWAAGRCVGGAARAA